MQEEILSLFRSLYKLKPTIIETCNKSIKLAEAKKKKCKFGGYQSQQEANL